MGKKFLALLILTAILLGPILSIQAAGEGKTVYLIPLEGEVERGLYQFLERAIAEANANDTSAIILELNTPGGFVDSAGDIRRLILNSPVPVYAYVRYQAFSAGAFLALSCRALYMAPGSSIGAAEIINLTGEEVSEKTVSAWEAEMRTVAEQQGKDPQVAAAMVRKSIAIEGLVDANELLTLTSADALRIGFTDGIFSTRSELYGELGLENAQEIVVTERPAERFARYVTSTYIAPLLIAIGLAALVIEILAAGFGVAGIVSILAFSLFFGGHIIAGLAGSEVIFLFIAGIILLLIEAFIPSFGIVGIGGVVAIVSSIVLSSATTESGLTTLFWAIPIAILIVAILYRYLRKSGLWSHIILQHAETVDRGYIGPTNNAHLVGKEGIALTTLRPAGAANIDGQRIDVVSEGNFIAHDTLVKVIKVEGTRVIVAPFKNE